MTLAFTTPRRFSPTLSLHVALLCICSSRHCFNQLLLCHPSQPKLLSLQTRTTMSGEKDSRLLMGSPIGIDCREMVHPQRRTVPDGPRLWHHIAAATRESRANRVSRPCSDTFLLITSMQPEHIKLTLVRSQIEPIVAGAIFAFFGLVCCAIAAM